MTWRVPPFDRAADELVAYVRANYSPLGIVISGSIVRGEAGPTSDFDVHVVHDEPWRLRDQKGFAGVPAELFVNPPAQIRRYFETEHAEGQPGTAHMFATGEPIEPVHPVITQLVREAREWLLRPVEATEPSLTQRRYGIVNLLDDARDMSDHDPAGAAMVLGAAVRDLVAYAFWQRKLFQPRPKHAIAALARIDGEAVALVRTWQTSTGSERFLVVEALARHVLGVDSFFEWTSTRETVAE